MLSSLVLLSLLPSLLAKPLAGNEHYAQNARRSLNALRPRSSSSSPSFGPESVTFKLGDKSYLSPVGDEFKSYKLESDWGLEEYEGKTMLVSVVNVDGEVTCDTLGKQVEKYASVDDVWDQGFMQGLVLSTGSSFHVAEDVSSCLKGWGGSIIIKSGNATSSVKDIGLAHVKGASIPSGPYLAKINGGVTLTEVYRLYREEAQAFTTASIIKSDGSFTDLASAVPGLNTLSIPVPSRLYTYDLPNPRPLEGKRIAVKDLFDMAGMKTGGGSRAYWNTYPEKEVTAVAIQRLIDQGGIIVGRAKTSQFANGEGATADWVDQMCPFNPRGDGYQQPSSSSSGPGAAIAAYDWLDITIGSDTGGSITGPAQQQGVYGLRPSWGAISLEGAIPLQATQDSAGFFTRDASEGAAFAKGWYGDKFQSYNSLPETLIFPNSSWNFAANYSGAAQFNAFRQALTDYVKPSNIEYSSFNSRWNTTGRFDSVGGLVPSAYLSNTYAQLITYYQWINFGRPWFEDYAAQNDGRVPFVSPSPLVRWNYARNNVTEADFQASLAKKQVFQDFITQDVLRKDNETCSNAIYVDVIGTGTTSYRNIYRAGTAVPIGFGYVSQFSGVPQIVLPIGQIAYNSTISNHTEYLPLSVTMYAAQGCDYMLWDLAAALQESGAISKVSAGSVTYPEKL